MLLVYYNTTKKESFVNFLIFMSAFFLVYSFIWNQDLGPYRDWDVYSASAIPYTLLSAILLGHLEEKEKRYTALIVVVVSAFHTFPWIIYNAFF